MIPLALIVILVVRSLVPAAGVLFFHWDPGRVLVLCFTDTMIGIAALVAALSVSWSRSPASSAVPGVLPGARKILGAVVGAVILVGFLAIPLGMPLVFMLQGTGFMPWLTLTDPQFRLSIGLQALASGWWCIVLLGRLRTQTPEQLGVKETFGLILCRWGVLIVVTYTGIPALFGRFGPYLLVVLYAGALMVSELNPRGFLRLFSSGRPTGTKSRRLPD